jgi:ribosome-associated protein
MMPQRFTQHEAHRRQLQYIGKVMRDIDSAPLQAALDVPCACRNFAHAGESVCSNIARDYPEADIQQAAAAITASCFGIARPSER